jgi:hypothetical protein
MLLKVFDYHAGSLIILDDLGRQPLDSSTSRERSFTNSSKALDAKKGYHKSAATKQRLL